MDYTFLYVLKKDLDDKGKYDLNESGVKRTVRGSNLKRALSALDRTLIEEKVIESKADYIVIDRVSF